MGKSIHVQYINGGELQKVHVDREKDSVSIELPDGSLRYSGNHIESALRLPEYHEPEPEKEPVTAGVETKKHAKQEEKDSDKDDKKADSKGKEADKGSDTK